ncbi:MAG: DUF4846 domain-containing protein [Bacteroidales bacterium]|nr:DUF4846 domain-containing protein [Bacteroidales bacterium]MBQ8811962.1 DUF4846 domain-containing protein [Bacteroidales bacterium]
MNTISKIIILVSILLSGDVFAQRKVCSVPPPVGFERQNTDGYGMYLRNLPLKPVGSMVKHYDGSVKGYQDGAYAVIDMEIGTRDLQQCADAVMRLRAEYLWHNKQYDQIHFNFTSGHRIEYMKWAQGYRTKVSGNNVSWYKGAEEDYSYATFRKYMDEIFMYAGTASLSKELTPTDVKNLKIGDVFIIGGHPGHVMIIVDMAHDNLGNKAIMVAQSYMPAQDIHIVTNLINKKLSP